MHTTIIRIEWHGMTLQTDLNLGHCIAIPLDHENAQPNAFFAPLYEATPHHAGVWVGDTRQGASVNFYNVRINPHGNGTHTECVGHISSERYSVHQALGCGRWLAQLISVYPLAQENGDRVLMDLDWESGAEALIVRTLPNHADKKSRIYGNTNPPYMDSGLARRLADEGIEHLLLDLPSVDREEDGGALLSHKAFWRYPENPRLTATITEMIYIDNVIPDGLYLLEIQIPALELDASPSRPFIYPLK
ncbi:MAG: cyclase family protein [Bacteroidota bacterium]|nr:cyclase family protein [Bacteroidota bacterium]